VGKHIKEGRMSRYCFVATFLLVFVFVVSLPNYANSEGIIFQDDFDSHKTWSNISGSPKLKGWTGYSSNWSPTHGYGQPDGEIIEDAHCGIDSDTKNKGKGFRVNVDRDWSAAGLHKQFVGDNTKHDELYFRWYQRYSKNFHWDQSVANSPGHKWIRLSDSTKRKIFRIGLGNGNLYWYSEVTEDCMYFDPLFTWEMFNYGNGCGNDCYGSDEWRCIELRVKLNTIYNGIPSNGIVQVWIDDVLVGEDKEAYIRKSPDQHLTHVQLGGNMSAPDMIRPIEYYVDIDDFVVSTRKINPLNTLAPPRIFRIVQ